MMNIYTDTDKQKIYIEYKNLKTYPYGSGTLIYGINDLSIDTETDLIRFNSSRTGGEQFYVWLNELQFNGVQSTRENINKLFQETCFNCCGGGGSITGDVKVDLTEIVNLLKEISDKVSHISGGGSCDISEVLCAIGNVDCALDTILEEEVGHYTTVEECNEMNDTIDNIIGEE